mgnify:FL=1
MRYSNKNIKHSTEFRQCSRPPHLHFPSTFHLHHPYFSISIYTLAPINQLQDYCSPIDNFIKISKFVYLPDSSSHSPKSVRLTQTPDITFGSSPRPQRHTASPASQTRASTPVGSATPRNFPPPGDKNKTAAILFTYSLYRSIPFFNSMNFPSKIPCNTCLHGIRCSLLTSDASITRKVV